MGIVCNRQRTLAPAIAVAVALLCALVALNGAAAPANAHVYSEHELDFLRLVNQYRAERGVPALALSDTLSLAAARHARDMGTHRFFSHTSIRSDYFPAGSSPWDRLRLTGYAGATSSGENIAAGMGTAADAFAAWKASAGHNRNMLDPSFRAIGIARRAVAGSPYGVYWATDFGSKLDQLSATSTIEAPFTDVDPSDEELWNAAKYVRDRGYFEGYPSGALGCWNSMTRRHVALVLERAGLGSRPDWRTDYRAATRGEVMEAFSGLEWRSGRQGDPILRSQVVRLLYRSR